MSGIAECELDLDAVFFALLEFALLELALFDLALFEPALFVFALLAAVLLGRFAVAFLVAIFFSRSKRYAIWPPTAARLGLEMHGISRVGEVWK